MPNTKPDWVKACRDTQKKLEHLTFEYEWDSDFDSCPFCQEARVDKRSDHLCFGCPIFKAKKKRCYRNWFIKVLFSYYSPDIPHVLALWLWLEDMKKWLKEGSL